MGRKKRILVADDSITIQKLVNVAFAGAHFEVILALDGHDALVKLKRLRPDMVLLDSDLRDFPREALQDEMSMEGAPRVIWMQEAQSETAVPDYVSKCLEKPFDAKVLSNAVFDLLEDEETTVVKVSTAKPLAEEMDDEEVTEKVAMPKPSGPFSSFRMVESQDSPVQAPDLSSRLESIAKEVVSHPAPRPSKYEDDEDTLRVNPKEFEQPVNIENSLTRESPAPNMDEVSTIAREVISAWVESNLPRIAEQLLKEEISKMSRSR